jgi:Uma2 family endonuclease
MGVSGIFTEDDRVELIDGDIVEMSPLGPRHVRSVNRLNMLLTPQLVGHAIVQVQSSLKLDVHQPVGAEYRLLQTLRIGDSITPQALPEHTFNLESILG